MWRRGTRRVLKWLGILAGVLVVLAALAGLGFATWWQTPRGKTYLRKQIEDRVNGAIAGHVTIDQISVGGLVDVNLYGIRLYPPDSSTPTASVDHARIDLHLVALLARRLDVHELLIEHPRIHLIPIGDSNTFARALSPKQPKSPQQPGTRRKTVLRFPRIRIRDGTLDTGGTKPLAISGFNLDGALDGPLDAVDITAAARAHIWEPVDREATLNVRGRYGPTVGVDLASLWVGGSHASISGFANLSAMSGSLQISDLKLIADDVNDFVPKAELGSDLHLTGTGDLRDGTLTAHFSAEGASGQATADATISQGTSWSDLLQYSLTVQSKHVDLEELRPSLPPIRLTAHAEATGKGHLWDDVTRLSVNANGSRYQDVPIERAELQGTWKDQKLSVSSLLLRTARMEGHASGWLTGHASNLNLTLDAPDLQVTREILVTGLGRDLPAMRGNARAKGHLRGAWANPQADLELMASNLAVGQFQSEGLLLTTSLSRLRPRLVGSFQASATRVRVGSRGGRHLTMQGQIDGHTASVDARGHLGGKPVQLIVRGERQPRKGNVDEWQFSRVEGHMLGLGMIAQQSVALTIGGGRVRLKGFQLTGDLGRVSLDADVGNRGPLQAHFQLTGLHLETIPADLLPPELKLAGGVDLHVDLSGTRARPKIDGTLQFQNGGFRSLKGLSFSSSVHLLEERISGSITGTLGPGRFSLTADLPTVSLKKGFATGAPPRPVTLNLETTALPLHDLLALSPRPMNIGGALTTRLEVSGSLRAPVIVLTGRLGDATGFGLQQMLLDLRASYAKGVWLADAHASHPDTLDVGVNGSLEASFDELVREGKAELRRGNLALSVSLRQLDLAWLSFVGYGPVDLAGMLAGRVSLTGSLDAPRLSGTVKGTRLAASGYKDVDAALDINGAEHVRLSGIAWLAGEPFLEARGAVNDSLAHLSTLGADDLFSTPFTLRALLANTSLERLRPIAAPIPGEEPSPFTASLGGSFDLSGTLNTPKANLHLVITENIRNDGVGGVLITDVAYADALMRLGAQLHSEQAGDFRASGTWSADLSAEALRQAGTEALQSYTGPPELKPSIWSAGLSRALNRPSDLTVDADHFDIALANGFSPSVRNLAGRLDLHLRKTGPLIPSAEDLKRGSILAGVSGSIAVADGALSLLGAGAFSSVSLKASGAYPSISLTEFKGHAGNGTFDGTAMLEEQLQGGYVSKLRLTLKDVPIIQNFQTRGYLSLQLDGTATGDSHHLHIPELTLREGHMVIPRNLPRRIQSLDPHPDIELPHRRSLAVSAQPTKPFTVQIDRIEVPDDFAIDAPLGNKLTIGATLALQYDPAFREEGNSPFNLTGKIRVLRGELSLLRKFTVDRGEVTFFPHDIEDPAVNIKAHYEGPDAKVTVTITGTLQNPERHFESTPQMEENEILYYLATGQRQTRPQQGDTAGIQTQLADATVTALGAAAIGVVQGAVQQLLPKEISPDVLSVEADLQRAGVGRVRAGKYYLNGKLYVGGRYNPSANPLLNENTYEGEAELRVGSDQYLRLLIGNEGHNQLYYLFERSFTTAKQRLNGVR